MICPNPYRRFADIPRHFNLNISQQAMRSGLGHRPPVSGIPGTLGAGGVRVYRLSHERSRNVNHMTRLSMALSAL
jgi:hypothetical protein